MPIERGTVALVALAFGLRVGAGLWRGDQAFIENGYSFYLGIADTFLAGHGLCAEPGGGCAIRMPLYPLIVSAFVASGTLPGLAILQAAIGAATVWLAFAIGRDLFSARIGLVAAFLTAVNPYAVVHDTALQDTSLFNAGMALSIWLLIKATVAPRRAAWIAAGLAVAVATLTTARLAIFVPLAIGGAAVGPGLRLPTRLTRVALVALPAMMLLGGWVVRNWQVVGAPVLTTDAGLSLWLANNPTTFEFLPDRSIDLNAERSYALLTTERQARLEALRYRDVDRDRLFLEWGRQWVVGQPEAFGGYALRKVWSAASGQLSPARAGLLQWGYAAWFIPIHILAAVGLWRSRHDAARHRPVYLLLAALAITTAVFWSHTSHKSVVDVVLFVYAASVFKEFWSGR